LPTEILIVEDDHFLALNLKKRLELCDYSVSAIVDSSEDAIAGVERLRPSLVLMDVQLRGPRDGIDTADLIRKQFRVPVIFVTGCADSETLDRARITEPFGYVVKPFQGVDFRAQIEMALWKHKMEQKLRLSEAWLSMTFQNVADALITTDADGNIATINPPAAQLTGWTSEEAQGQALLTVFDVVDEATELAVTPPLLLVGSAKSAGRPADGVLSEPPASEGKVSVDPGPPAGPPTFKLTPRGTGETLIVEAEVSAIRDECKLNGFIVVFRDISARREAEKQARRLQKMNAMSLLATGLGRELAESQNRMETCLKQLIERSEGGAGARLLWDVYERCAQQQATIQQLIALGRSEAGQVVPLDINEWLSGMEDQIRKVVGVNRTLTLKLQPGTLPIQIDPRKLRENLLRLAEDARLATAHGGEIVIETSVQGTRRLNPRVQIVVRDDRKPLKGVAKERAFDPYYQARPGKRNPGFSLALVYQFVAISGGTIELESRQGEGSAYLISFPALEGSGKTIGDGGPTENPRTGDVHAFSAGNAPVAANAAC
jgi:signal transduction histidine kinase/DNA-binding NarL/FixJ family response regulator